MADPNYLQIVSHYEGCLEKHGDSHLGVDWPNATDAEKRYQVMLEAITGRAGDRPVSLLDFGCGTGALLSYMQQRGLTHLHYTGLDLSAKFVEVCREKFPGVPFQQMDVLVQDDLGSFDYIVLNGVFTEKRGLTYEEMQGYFQRLIKTLFQHANVGLAFNVMSKHVDWEREDLFHLPFDVLAAFLKREVSRNFVFRNDYGLYEYTTYLYK